MICLKCNNKNKQDGAFCSFCGNKLIVDNTINNSVKAIFIRKIKGFLNLNQKVVIISVIVLLLSVTTIFAAPKVKDYFTVNKVISIVESLQAEGSYQDALGSLNNVDDRWMFESTRKKIDNLKEQQNNFIQYKNSYDLAILKEGSGDLEGAREVLLSIQIDYPNYGLVKEMLTSVQSKIEGKLNNKVAAASAAKAAAEQSAQASAAQAALSAQAKAQADAQAAAAAQAAASAQAAAAASAQAAAAAQAQAQQEAINRAIQVKMSFRSELINAYNSVLAAANTYSTGVQYSNANNSIMAISTMISALGILDTVLDNISNLNTRYTNLPSNYYSATNNLISAIHSLSNAMDLVVDQQNTTLDYSSQVNSYKDQYLSYIGMVKSFFDQNN